MPVPILRTGLKPSLWFGLEKRGGHRRIQGCLARKPASGCGNAGAARRESEERRDRLQGIDPGVIDALQKPERHGEEAHEWFRSVTQSELELLSTHRLGDPAQATLVRCAGDQPVVTEEPPVGRRKVSAATTCSR
jgi:hypothetical protein